MADPFSLLSTVLIFGNKFFQDDPQATTTRQKSSTADGFGFISSAAKSLIKSRKPKKRISTIPRPRPRSISQLTKGNKFQGVANMSPASRFFRDNTDLSAKMALLQNSTNKDIIRLIPSPPVTPVLKQKETITISPSKVGDIT